MTFLRFGNEPSGRHRVRRQGAALVVDDVPVQLRDAGGGDFVAAVAGRNERLHAVADGELIHVQLRGRAHRIERIDPSRGGGNGGAASGAAGASLAPMPGVVVSLQVRLGQSVRTGDALLVIESMKLQLTIAAAADGVVEELPVAVGQSFQRGATLARIATEGAA